MADAAADTTSADNLRHLQPQPEDAASMHVQSTDAIRAEDAATSSATPLSLLTSSFPLPVYTPLPLPFSVRWCVAPMVGASDLCFRMLTRRHGASVCYTPMLHADRVADDAYFRSAVDFAHPTRNAPGGEDRPLIAQFAANDSAQLLAAALRVQPFVDAVDLNLGCPQASALEGRFGSYLLSRRQWPLVSRMVRTLRAHLTVPVTAKIRLLSSHDETLALCNLLIDSGCSGIAIHGRQRGSDKRRRVGAADLQAIARLRAELPRQCTIIANGNIRCFEDAQANLHSTRCEGVMSAEAVLANPRLFAGEAATATASLVQSAASFAEPISSSSAAAPPPSCLELSLEYLSLCSSYPSPPSSWLSDHVHNFCRAAISRNQWMDLKAQLKSIGRERNTRGDGSLEAENGATAQQAADGASARPSQPAPPHRPHLAPPSARAATICLALSCASVLCSRSWIVVCRMSRGRAIRTRSCRGSGSTNGRVHMKMTRRLSIWTRWASEHPRIAVPDAIGLLRSSVSAQIPHTGPTCLPSAALPRHFRDSCADSSSASAGFASLPRFSLASFHLAAMRASSLGVWTL